MTASVCVHCDAPAIYRQLRSGDPLCQACAIYIAGQHHGRAMIARMQLSIVINELRAAALTREHIETMVDGELEDVFRPAGPDIGRPDDPRPWVHYLLDAIP